MLEYLGEELRLIRRGATRRDQLRLIAMSLRLHVAARGLDLPGAEREIALRLRPALDLRLRASDFILFEVIGFRIENGRVRGVETTRGFIAAGKIGLAVAGHTGQVAALAGLRLPIETHVLQAFVSEPVKRAANSGRVACSPRQKSRAVSRYLPFHSLHSGGKLPTW